MKIHGWVRVLSAPFLLAALTFCGGESEPKSPSPDATSAGSTPAPTQQRPAVARARSEAKMGGVGELPSDFPAGFPNYPGAMSTQSMALPGAPTLVSFEAGDAKEQVYQFYREELAEQGWEIERESGDSSHLTASKDGRRATVNLWSEGKQTHYGVSIE